MSRRVRVRFGAGAEYEFEVHEADVMALDFEDARSWLMDEFDALGCEPPNPLGKVTVVDMILGVAARVGRDRFERDPGWAGQYARACACLRDTTQIDVDVAEFVVR